MREAIQRVLLAFFAASLVVPAVLLPRPERADAFLGCFLGAGINKLIGGVQDIGKDIANSFSAISTNDAGVKSATREVRNEAATIKIKECTLDGMVTLLGQTMLQKFTRDIVDWINTGFNGEPAFVTNPEGFLGEVADRVVGQQIKAVAPFLCQPFRLQLQLALGLQYSSSRQREIGCTLSQVIDNLQGSYQGFVGGDFRQGGWQNWLAIAGTPQNNAYGSYFATTDKLNASIVTATGEQIKLLDWGKGFKSWRKCLVRNEDVEDPTTPGKTIKGDCVQEGPIQTPGSIIVDQTSGALKTQMDRFQVADEIDEILGALTNQLLSRAMGGIGGLLGASQAGAGGVRYIDTLIIDLDAAARAADAPIAPPTGIDCRQEARYVQGSNSGADAGKLMYRGEDGNLVVARTPIGGTVEVAIDGKYKTGANGAVNWVAYFTDISRGCANVVDRFIADRADRVAGIVTVAGDGGGGGVPPPPVTENIASGKEADMSSVWIDGHRNCDRNNIINNYTPGAQNAINGNPEGNAYGGLMATNCVNPREWWMVDLGKNTGNTTTAAPNWDINEVSEIKIFGATDNLYGYFENSPNNPFKVYVTRTDPRSPAGRGGNMSTITQFEDNYGKGENTVLSNGMYFLAPINGKNDQLTQVDEVGKAGSLVQTIKFSPPLINARYVTIMRRMPLSHPLVLAEVEVFGKQTPFGTAGTSQTGAPLSVTVAPAPKPIEGSPPPTLCGASRLFTTSHCQQPGRGETVSNIVKLTANRSTTADEKVAVSVQLARRGDSVGTSFSMVFFLHNAKAFFARITEEGGALVLETPSFVFNVPSENPPTRMNPGLAQTDSGWNFSSAVADISGRIFALNASRDGLDLRTNTSLNKFLNAPGKPVFIAAGLSLAKDKPLFISFTGTLAGLPPSDYDLLVNVFTEKNGTLTSIAKGGTVDLQINMRR